MYNEEKALEDKAKKYLQLSEAEEAAARKEKEK